MLLNAKYGRGHHPSPQQPRAAVCLFSVVVKVQLRQSVWSVKTRVLCLCSGQVLKWSVEVYEPNTCTVKAVVRFDLGPNHVWSVCFGSGFPNVCLG